jgi:hypothetical protein
MQPQGLIGQSVYTDDHSGRFVDNLKVTTPLCDQPAVTGEHHRLGPIRRT